MSKEKPSFITQSEVYNRSMILKFMSYHLEHDVLHRHRHGTPPSSDEEEDEDEDDEGDAPSYAT